MHLKYLYTGTRAIGRFSIDSNVFNAGLNTKAAGTDMGLTVRLAARQPVYSGSMLTRLDALTDKYPDSVSLLTESRPACSGLFNLIHGVTLMVMKMARVIIDFYG